MADKKYYDGTKLLSLRDIDGDIPDIYMVVSNNTAGKTTYFNRMATNRFFKKGQKFILFVRFAVQLQNIANRFFGDIQGLFFADYIMTQETLVKDSIIALYIQKRGSEASPIQCGYAISLNAADKVKENSHMINDGEGIYFDEFQSQTNHYCPDEINKFWACIVAISRGNGKQHRRVPIYMMSNPITMLNPYYMQWDIPARLQKDTHFLKGSGWVMEYTVNTAASEALKKSGIGKAFANSPLLAYSADASYLNDSDNFIEKIKGSSKYMATLIYKNEYYSIKEYRDKGIIYIDNRYSCNS